MKKMRLDLQFFASDTVSFNKITNGKNAYMEGRILVTTKPQDSNSNYSLVEVELQARRVDNLSTPTSGWYWKGQVKIVDDKNDLTPISFTSMGQDFAVGHEWVTFKVVSGLKVYHADDGTCNPTISGYITGPTGSSFAGITSSGSKEVKFDTIPRATSLDSFSGSKRIGVANDVVINFTRKSSKFTTTLEYATTSNFSDAVKIVDKSTNASTYSWTIPIGLLNKIPNSKTLKIYVRLTTYDGNTQIGNAQTSSFDSIVYEDNCRPVWNTHTIEETDATAKQLVTTANKFIANLSKPKFTFSATGQYGATIKYYQVNNTTRTSGFTDSAFNTNGYTIKVVDSRGVTNTYTFTTTYVPYFTPIFEEVKLFRDTPTSNKVFSYFKIKFFNNTSSVKFDNPQALSYKFNYQEAGGTAQEKIITPETYDDGTSRYAENETELGNTFNYKKSVDWTFSFVDLTGKTFTTNTTLPMGIPLMNGKTEEDGEQVLYINGKIKGEGIEPFIKKDTDARVSNVVSRNIFDGTTKLGRIDFNTGKEQVSDTGIRNQNFIKVKANTQYIFSNNGEGVGMNVFMYDKDKNYLYYESPGSGQSFSTSQSTRYINFFRSNDNADKIQLEEGQTINPYVPYLNLEEAMQKEEIYSTSEVRIGTWIDGKPLYRKVITLQNIDLGSANEYAIHDISNYDVIFVPKYFIYNATDINGIRLKMVESTCYEVSANSYMHILAFQNNLLYQSNMWKYIEYGYVVIEYTKTTD